MRCNNSVTLADITALLQELTSLVADKSEGNKFTILQKAKPVFAHIFSLLDEPPSPDKDEIITQAARLAVDSRHWDHAVLLFEYLIKQRSIKSNTLMFGYACALRMKGRYPDSEEAFSQVTKTFRLRSKFRREYERLQKAKQSLFIEEIETSFRQAYSSASAETAKHSAALVHKLRGSHDIVSGQVESIIEAVIRGVDGRPPLADMGQPELTSHVFIGGFGWSGSGAVFDFLKQSRIISTPFGSTELSIFDGLTGSDDSVSSLVHNLHNSPENLSNAINNIVIECILGLKLKPRAQQESYVYKKSLIYQFRQDNEKTQKFLKSLQHCISHLYHDRQVQVASALKHISGLCCDALELCGSPGKTSIHNNSIHAKNVAVLSCLPGAKMVAVSRDPRDQFVARQIERQRGSALSAKKFIANQLEAKRVYEMGIEAFGLEKRVLAVRFEDFICSEAARDELCRQLDLPKDSFSLLSSFDPSQSRRNVGVHRHYPDQGAISAIAEALL